VGLQAQLRVDLAYNNRDDLTTLTRSGYTGGTAVPAGTTAYGYDDARRLTALTHQNAAPATLSYYNYGLDNADRVTAETWQSGAAGGTHSYAYDTADQLTGEQTATGTTTYVYDLNGNRTAVGTPTGTHAYQTDPGNRLHSDGVYTYSYDGEGNEVGKVAGGASPDTWVYAYDQRNMLVGVTEKSDGVTTSLLITYSYDALGERAEEDRWQGGVTTTTRFAYGGDGVWAEVSSTNVVQTRYVWGDGPSQLWARVDTGLGVRWYLTDRLGSVRDVTDGLGAGVLDHLEYDGFGTIVNTEASPADGGRYTYAAYAGDRATGLYHTDWREDQAPTGTWNQEDPEGFDAGDPNLHRYLGNGPTNAVDPSGLKPKPTLGYKPGPGPLAGKYGAFVWPILWEPKGEEGVILQRIDVKYGMSYQDARGMHPYTDDSPPCWQGGL
jgi:RHS repeat-associated protein